MPNSPPKAQTYKRKSATPQAKEKRSPEDIVRSKARWQHKRAYKLSIHPICQRCAYLKQVTNRSTIRLSVHHIEAMRIAPAKTFDDDNLLTLCIPCHSRFDSLEMRGMYDQAIKEGQEVREGTQ